MHILTLEFFLRVHVLSIFSEMTHWLSAVTLGAGGDFRPDSAEATVHIMNEFIGSMSLGQPKKWGEGAEN